MDDGHGKLTFGQRATPTPESANDVRHCQEFTELHVITKNVQSIRDPSRFDDFLLRLMHVTLIYYAFVKPGVVMILNRGRQHWVINCSFPEVQPIVVLELALGESLLWKCLTSTFMLFLKGFARYTRQSSM